ncbi:Glu/Leu/Phe/Val dehydrogenase dimerization domain-containing protein [Nitrincola nitratireducens]|uniref:Leucine dehydrogenase n=1 Tax=Nitrincola nitratireducens TaxID=1229521 RepID=W9UQV6_9GAMM|nr:Glu/Leu/Phe/Val dehydrogenase dimerization domain-containing protein [Nitrincola nitratireducens]EXJ09464.1 Leucine dehydrogenase [Nitrincola nitratireducens]
MSVFQHVEFEQHEQVVFFHDASSGLKAIVAIHDTQLGPALGGCRMWPYESESQAITDVLRLSKGMTYKSALANLKLGGGKSVIIGHPRQDKSQALLEAMGRCLESLGGRYIAAEDSGTGVADLKVMSKHTSYVAGIHDRPGLVGGRNNGDPSPATAYGVFVGLQAAVQARFGHRSLQGLKVAIQGVGNVGYRLAQHLHAAGAQLYVSDIYPDAVAKAQAELGATVVSSDEIASLDVDVFAPCAMGAVLNDASIQAMQAKVVAGAANNQLERECHDRQLHEKGILYAPDFAINAGGIIDIYYERVGYDPLLVKSHVEGVSNTLSMIFERSQVESRPTGAIALELAKEKIRNSRA